jgi:class 3 adenylate cyclase/DNA-binding beta-propeller fold protein YncE
MRPRQERVLVAVLFTDIVGSSTVLAELGDRRWRALVTRHHALVRSELKRHGGREVDTAGDGFFAVFTDQEQAIRCACAISDAVRELGVEVRAGLTAGQVERSGRTYGGLTVHTGARIMASAGPGEVLVSGVLRDLVGGAGIEFTDVGGRLLKGIPDEVHLYAVAALDGVPRTPPLTDGAAIDRRAQIEPPPLVQRRTRVTLIAASLAIAACVGAGFALFGGRTTVHVAPSSVLRVDPANGQLLSDTVVMDPTGTSLVPGPGHRLFAFSYSKRFLTMLHVTPSGVEVTGTNSNLGGSPVTHVYTAGMAFSGGWIWIANAGNTVTQADPKFGRTGATFNLPGTPSLVADVAGTPWVVCHDSGRIWTFDAQSNRFVRRHAARLTDPRAITYREGAVWITDFGNNQVTRIDPAGGPARQYTLPPGTGPSGILVAFGYVWTANLGSGLQANPETVSRIDISTGRVEMIPIGGETQDNSSDVVASPDGRTLWVTSPGSGNLVQIDPSGQRPHVIHRVHVGFDPQDMTMAYGSLWAVISGY